MVLSTASNLYIGRFAPSPSGPLHNGSLVAAMASYLDARCHNGTWLVRIEDIDTPRVVAGADKIILQQLKTLGMHWDGEILYQSQRLPHYQKTFEQFKQQDLIYGCACTRKAIEDYALEHKLLQSSGERPYPGICRNGLDPSKTARAWRFKIPDNSHYAYTDRWLGMQKQDINSEVGDFIIKRADQLFAYQWVVVLDDISQKITHIVRGADLLSSTARQHLLMKHFNYAPPIMMHVPLVMDAHGNKLSKQNHASAINVSNPIQSLMAAWQFLGFEPFSCDSVSLFWPQAMQQWHKQQLTYNKT